jgi:hypothetical protein
MRALIIEDEFLGTSCRERLQRAIKTDELPTHATGTRQL